MPKKPRAIKEGDWTNWEELDKKFGKLKWLYYMGIAENDNFEISLRYDGRRKKSWQIQRIKLLNKNAKRTNLQ